MKTESPAPGAVELLLLAGLVALEAAAVLLLALVVLVLAGVASPRPTSTRSSAKRRTSGSPARLLPPPPVVHPLALVAAELEALPVSRLRPMAGTRSKRASKAELVAMLAAC